MAEREVTNAQLTVCDVYFVGVDLAWGERKPTGIAAVDADGVLRHVGAAITDADILAGLEPYLTGDCVVAFDAPLVVTNPSGTRGCEAALNRDFRRFDAGAHPANTGLAWFSDGGRGARLCRALNLDLNPGSSSPRTGMEVYPHAAAVSLFDLPRTLKYKHKTGRDFPQLRSELLRLMGFIEELQTATPVLEVGANLGWARLKESVLGATRKAELRRAEDPVDAVLCAYIARFATARPHDVTVYGDADTGCIVTPRCPVSPSSH
jgi:predicted RNase H-like nuclease